MTRGTLARLQRGGVRVLPDDLGAGYASIGYLREIHFDGIKLDGSLIASLLQNAAAHNLLTRVIYLSKAIGAPMIAEVVISTRYIDAAFRHPGGRYRQ